MERTFGQAAGFEPTTAERHFRIGLREALEPSVLPELSQLICAAGPRLSLASARHDRPRLETDLAAGEFDVALDVLLDLTVYQRLDQFLEAYLRWTLSEQAPSENDLE